MLNIKEKYEKCWYCENFYGENYGESVCLTCHYFLFPDLVDDNDDTNSNSNLNRQQLDEKLESNDSGNEDSVDGFEQQQASTINNQVAAVSASSSSSNKLYKTKQQTQQQCQNELQFEKQQKQQFNRNIMNINNSQQASCLINNEIEFNEYNNESNTHNNSNINSNNNNIEVVAFNINNSLLNERIIALTTYKNREIINSLGNIDILPNEVLIKIFRNLDDLSLWSVSLVNRKWNQLIKNEINQDEWKSYVSKRWILYKPAINVSCWQNIYTQLVESSNCLYCLKNIYNRNTVSNIKEFQTSWRHKRLLLELKALQQDPPEGINAKPLDTSCFYWQAAITGPHSSPYEGGIFYIFLQIPQSYPLKPPLVRFITKIYHPNISRHGDIGLDSIHDNWSLALTISKVLISIQSLLTDPYTNVCMENEISYVYNTNRSLYEKIARLYTWQYAMNDYMEFNYNDFCLFNKCIENIKTNNNCNGANDE